MTCCEKCSCYNWDDVCTLYQCVNCGDIPLDYKEFKAIENTLKVALLPQMAIKLSRMQELMPEIKTATRDALIGIEHFHGNEDERYIKYNNLLKGLEVWENE